MAEGRKFDLDEGTVLVVHDDGRVRRAPLPSGIDPDTFRNALAAVDTLYRREGVFPSPEETAKYWDRISLKTYRKIWALEEFKTALDLRGISMDANAGLTPEQANAILLLSDPTDRRTVKTRLTQLGISQPKYQAWMRNPLFAETLRKRSEDNLKDGVSVAINRLIGNADAGDQRAIEKLLEVSGRYNPQNAELTNARQLILKLIEIIVRRVDDPATKKAIMEDLNEEMTIVQYETKMLE